MSVLTKDDVVRLLLTSAKQHDPRERFHREDLEEFVSIVFASFEVRGKSFAWNFPEATELLKHASDYEFIRYQLKQQAAVYIDQLVEIHEKRVDWLFASLLLAAEVVALARTLGIGWRYRNGKFQWGTLALVMIFAAIGWGVWLALTIAVAVFMPSLILWVWVGLTMIHQLNAWRVRRRSRLLLAQMAGVYEAVRSPILSWDVIWQMLGKTRDAGAVWDPELYRIVEVCRAKQIVVRSTSTV